MKPQRNNLKKILNEHSKWVFSLGKAGKLADYKNWQLDKLNLENEDLPFSKLQFVSLKGAHLSGINFRRADLLRGSFIGAYLDDADLAGANLSGGDLSFAKCMGANFADANLEGANFEGTELFKDDFDETYLRGLNIENINLPEADHEDANFSDSILNKTKLVEIGLNNQNFDKTTLNLRSNIKLSKEDIFVDLNAVNPSMIEEAIVDLIEKLKSNIQFDQVKAICAHKNFIESIDKIDFKNGDIVTHDGEVAFKLDFNITYNLSLLLDREGKLINVFRSVAKQIEQ